MLIRLNKYLSEAGIASRRKADEMITEGRVGVNNRLILELGHKIDPDKDRVTVDGKEVKNKGILAYIMLNKPKGYLVTMKDELGRPTVVDLLPSLKVRVFPVGRLDFDSEGLLLFTNDGELAHRLIHPRYRVRKTYIVGVKGTPQASKLSRLRKGIFLDGRKSAPARVTLIQSSARRSIIKVELHEGRKREIRRMFQVSGHHVVSLKRIGFAGLALENLGTGKWRFLKKSEIRKLKELVALT